MKQLAEVALAALANTRRLFEDAHDLAQRGRHASAYLIAGLAADELGKHILLTSFYSREDTDEEWRRFWQRFRRHQEKLGNALWSSWVGDLLTDDPPPNAEAFHQRRLTATYVDVQAHGAVSLPETEITEGEVRDLLAKIEQELHFCETTLKNATADQLGEHFERMRSSGLVQELRERIAEYGSIGVMAYAIALRAGQSHEDALEFVRQTADVFGSNHHAPRQD